MDNLSSTSGYTSGFRKMACQPCLLFVTSCFRLLRHWVRGLPLFLFPSLPSYVSLVFPWGMPDPGPVSLLIQVEEGICKYHTYKLYTPGFERQSLGTKTNLLLFQAVQPCQRGSVQKQYTVFGKLLNSTLN